MDIHEPFSSLKCALLSGSQAVIYSLSVVIVRARGSESLLIFLISNLPPPLDITNCQTLSRSSWNSISPCLSCDFSIVSMSRFRTMVRARKFQSSKKASSVRFIQANSLLSLIFLVCIALSPVGQVNRTAWLIWTLPVRDVWGVDTRPLIT